MPTMRDPGDYKLYLRRMMTQAVIRWANAPEGGSWELVSVDEEPFRTLVTMETRHPGSSIGAGNTYEPMGSRVRVSIEDIE